MAARMDLALRMKSEIQAQAQLRQKAGVKVDPPENLREGSKHDRETNSQVAALAGVSGRTLDKYEAVTKTGTAELISATSWPTNWKPRPRRGKDRETTLVRIRTKVHRARAT